MPMVFNYFCLMVKFTLNYLWLTCQLILTCEIAKITSHSPVANLKGTSADLKNGVWKSIVRVIKHTNFQHHTVHTDGVISKT